MESITPVTLTPTQRVDTALAGRRHRDRRRRRGAVLRRQRRRVDPRVVRGRDRLVGRRRGPVASRARRSRGAPRRGSRRRGHRDPMQGSRRRCRAPGRCGAIGGIGPGAGRDRERHPRTGRDRSGRAGSVGRSDRNGVRPHRDRRFDHGARRPVDRASPGRSRSARRVPAGRSGRGHARVGARPRHHRNRGRRHLPRPPHRNAAAGRRISGVGGTRTRRPAALRRRRPGLGAAPRRRCHGRATRRASRPRRCERPPSPAVDRIGSRRRRRLVRCSRRGVRRSPRRRSMRGATTARRSTCCSRRRVPTTWPSTPPDRSSKRARSVWAWAERLERRPDPELSAAVAPMIEELALRLLARPRRPSVGSTSRRRRRSGRGRMARRRSGRRGIAAVAGRRPHRWRRHRRCAAPPGHRSRPDGRDGAVGPRRTSPGATDRATAVGGADAVLARPRAGGSQSTCRRGGATTPSVRSRSMMSPTGAVVDDSGRHDRPTSALLALAVARALVDEPDGAGGPVALLVGLPDSWAGATIEWHRLAVTGACGLVCRALARTPSGAAVGGVGDRAATGHHGTDARPCVAARARRHRPGPRRFLEGRGAAGTDPRPRIDGDGVPAGPPWRQRRSRRRTRLVRLSG